MQQRHQGDESPGEELRNDHVRHIGAVPKKNRQSSDDDDDNGDPIHDQLPRGVVEGLLRREMGAAKSSPQLLGGAEQEEGEQLPKGKEAAREWTVLKGVHQKVWQRSSEPSHGTDNPAFQTETQYASTAPRISIASAEMDGGADPDDRDAGSGPSNDGAVEGCSGSGSGDGDQDRERQQWNNPIEFLLSCIAMSVGLGNVWRFPFTAYENGGGAFLVPYLLVLVFIGRPLYFMELAVGQFSSLSTTKMFQHMAPAFRGIGMGQIFATAAVLSYYTCLIALAVFYLVASFSPVLPWVVCHEELRMNDTICIPSGSNASDVIANLTAEGVLEPGQNFSRISAAEQYFLHGVLKGKATIEDGLGSPDLKLMGCLGVCYLMVFLVMWKGVHSIGKVSYFTAIFPYVVLITLCIKGFTLPGSKEGILFYITPKWDKLLEFDVWYAAVTQSFFSLSVGSSSIITLSSYNNFRHNTYRDAIIISVTDTFTSLLAGFTIFSILGNLAFELNVPVERVIKSGTGLAFISYPMAIGKFDFLPQLFSVLFFLMLITLGMGSVIGLMSAVIAVVQDDHPHLSKTMVAAVSCVAGFFVGLVYLTPGGQHILSLVDYFAGAFIIFALASLEVVAISWIYGLDRFCRDIKFMLNLELSFYFRFSWGCLIPVSLLGMLFYSLYNFKTVEYSGVPLPDQAMYAGVVLVAFAGAQVPFWFMYAACMSREDSCSQKISSTFRPSKEWGPKKAIHKLEWIEAEYEWRLRKAEEFVMPLR